MISKDWFVDKTGHCQSRPASRTWNLLRESYYFHQFLSEVLDIIANANHEEDEWNYLPQIREKVRQIVTNSYWLKTKYKIPDRETGVHVTTLYDEIGYPLTVQNVTTQPGALSSIHNHGTWGVIFQIQGEERHTFWHRVSPSDAPLQIEPVGEHLLSPGEILSFHPDAIHQAETVGRETALTFQLYGDTQPKGRFKFEPKTQTAKYF
ncbi:metal-dependent enzyme of the double-stranded beta helix superfamily [Geitlerinema sp. FC II]|nr:metal-dependent enzyme of the double-stranded beta helix superfamily [Geitlerinema sp. FC II]